MRLSEIEGLDVKHLIMAKFTSKEWVRSFIEGNIYMNNFKYFIDQEKQTRVKGQGDSYEGAHVIEFANAKIYDEKGNLVGTAEMGNVVERYEVVNRLPMFCVANFGAEDFKVLEQGEDFIKIQLDIPNEHIKKIKEVFQSDTVALTFSPHEFMKRFETKAKKEVMGLAYGMVTYADYKMQDEVRKESFDNGGVDVLFTKHNSLDYQKEFRFVLTKVETDAPITLSIGSLEDIFHIMDVDDFLTGTFIELKFRDKVRNENK